MKLLQESADSVLPSHVQPSSGIRDDRAFLVIVACAVCVYSACFIFGSSFLINGTRYFSLFDDEMISMRYARNFSQGAGLVWNPGGERVEGFTNPLWVLLMTLFHFLPFPRSLVSICMQIVGLGFHLATVFAAYRLVKGFEGIPWWCARTATILVAAYYPLLNWSLQGTEVGALAFITTMAAVSAMKRDVANPRDWEPYAWLGVGLYVRPDMVIPYLVIWGYLLLIEERRRVFHLVAGGFVLAAAMGSQTAFRLWYFGDVLPNTYYLKLVGYPLLDRISRGSEVAGQFLFSQPWPLLLPLAVWTGIRRPPRQSLLLILFLIQLSYSVFVGGDAWEWWGGSNRYVSIAMPAFLVWASVETTLGIHALSERRWILPRFSTAVTIVCLSFVLIVENTRLTSKGMREWLLQDPPPSVMDNLGQLLISSALNKVTTSDASIAVIWAGAVPYFTDRVSIDILGKSDRYVAHLPMRSELPFFPGHMKWDYSYSFGRLNPDVIVQLWKYPNEARPYFIGRYTPKIIFRSPGLGTIELLFRNDSPHIIWSKLGGPPISAESRTGQRNGSY